MSQSLLYHGFGLRGVSYRSTSYLGNAIIFHSEVKDRHVACPSCGKKDTIFKGQNWPRIGAALREWTGENVKLQDYKGLKAVPKDLKKVALEYSKAAFAAASTYLIKRGLNAKLTSSFRFKETFKVDTMGNVLFPHINQKGLCGFEKKNHNFTGFPKGSYKGSVHDTCKK